MKTFTFQFTNKQTITLSGTDALSALRSKFHIAIQLNSTGFFTGKRDVTLI